MFGIVINQEGFKVEFVVLNEDRSPQFYELKEGESVIEDGWQIANSMNKPQWVNGKWIDTDPLPPIEEIPQQPNEMEVLKEEVIALEKENKLLKAQVEALSQTSDFHKELIVEMANKVYA